MHLLLGNALHTVLHDMLVSALGRHGLDRWTIRNWRGWHSNCGGQRLDIQEETSGVGIGADTVWHNFSDMDSGTEGPSVVCQAHQAVSAVTHWKERMASRGTWRGWRGGAEPQWSSARPQTRCYTWIRAISNQIQADNLLMAALEEKDLGLLVMRSSTYLGHEHSWQDFFSCGRRNVSNSKNTVAGKGYYNSNIQQHMLNKVSPLELGYFYSSPELRHFLAVQK